VNSFLDDVRTGLNETEDAAPEDVAAEEVVADSTEELAKETEATEASPEPVAPVEAPSEEEPSRAAAVDEDLLAARASRALERAGTGPKKARDTESEPETTEVSTASPDSGPVSTDADAVADVTTAGTAQEEEPAKGVPVAAATEEPARPVRSAGSGLDLELPPSTAMMAGGGALFLGGTAANFLWVNPAWSAIQDARDNPETLTRSQASELTADFNRRRLVTLGLLGAGMAVAGGGMVLQVDAAGTVGVGGRF
jgi:hypothetical protein